MHQLGKILVERVLDVRRRHSEGSETVAPGESLEFLAQIRGWQSEVRAQRRAHLLQLGDIGLRVALAGALRQAPMSSSSRKSTLRMKYRSMEMKVGGIEYAQSYGAGSAGDAMSERNALGSRRTNGSESSLPRVRSVRVWAECQQAPVASLIRGDKCSTNDQPGTPGPHRTNQGWPERKDLMRTRTKRKVLLGANVGNVSRGNHWPHPECGVPRTTGGGQRRAQCMHSGATT